MPNHCYNILTLSGEKVELEKFYDDNKDSYIDDKGEEKIENLCFSKSIPIIDEENGYNERIEKWGTKWEPWDIEISKDYSVDDNLNLETSLEYYFETAWSPPLEWLSTVCPRYPNIIFKISYEDESLCFWGEREYHGEENIMIMEYTYEEMIDYIAFYKNIYPEDVYNYIIKKGYDIRKILIKYRLTNEEYKKGLEIDIESEGDSDWKTIDSDEENEINSHEENDTDSDFGSEIEYEENMDRELLDIIIDYNNEIELFRNGTATTQLLKYVLIWIKDSIKGINIIQSSLRRVFQKIDYKTMLLKKELCVELAITPPLANGYPGGREYHEAMERFNGTIKIKN